MVTFGADNVFLDIHSVDYGENYFDVFARTLNKTDHTLVVTGPGWANTSDEAGRRLDRPVDVMLREERKQARRLIHEIHGSTGAPPAFWQEPEDK